MNCPVCQHPELPAGTTKCQKCGSDLEAFEHLKILGRRLRKRQLTINAMSIFAVTCLGLFIILISMFNGKDDRISELDDSIQTIKQENSLLRSELYEKDMQLKNVMIQQRQSPSVEEQNFYMVKKGESLWKVAETKLGDGNKYKQIAEDNNISNPDIIEPGTKLNIRE